MKEITRLYILRHGETEWNRKGLMQGHKNSPLTENGKNQARALAEAMSEKGIKRIYSSDLGRAMETTEIINSRLKLPVKQDLRLREQNLGIMQGMTKTQFREKYPKEWARFSTWDPDYSLPEGETARQKLERSVGCLEELAEKHPGENLLIVSHGGILDSVFRSSQKIPLNHPRSFSIYNGAVNRFSLSDGHWVLETWGDLSHLKGINTRDDD